MKSQLKMKKSLALVLTGLAFSTTSFAASTGTLNISGTVAATYSLTVTPKAAASSLPIVAGQASALSIATVNEVSNDTTGYRIMVSSLNGGVLKHGTNSSSTLAYQIAYDGKAYGTPPASGSSQLLAAPRVSTTHSMKVASSNSPLPGGTDSDVAITFAAFPTALAGTYSDTITFEIAAP